MKEKINSLIKGIIEIDNRLSDVEVKGFSVEKLFSARMMLKQLAEEIQKIIEKIDKDGKEV